MEPNTYALIGITTSGARDQYPDKSYAAVYNYILDANATQAFPPPLSGLLYSAIMLKMREALPS